MEQDKKISFGFSKSTKKINIFQKPSPKRSDVQLIDCVEAQTIKIKGKVEEKKEPLVIPMPESSFNIFDRRRQLKTIQEPPPPEKETPESELTADEIAARELIKEVQNRNVDKEQKVFVLPAVTENVIDVEGKEEPTLEDYESVPVSDYGLAMLRGMGWKEGTGIGKNKAIIKVIEPELRPKGMGLGVKKINQAINKTVDENGKELILTKKGYAKIIDGKHKGNYCEVQGFDDEAGRVIVKTSLQGLILSLNEFLVTPVTKEEYVKSCKVINITQYEEYKNKEIKDIKVECKSEHSRKDITTDTDSDVEDKSRRNKKNGQYKNRHKHKKSSTKSKYAYSNSSDGESSDEKRYREKSKHSRHKHKQSYESKTSKDKKYKYSSDSEREHRHKYDSSSSRSKKHKGSKKR